MFAKQIFRIPVFNSVIRGSCGMVLYCTVQLRNSWKLFLNSCLDLFTGHPLMAVIFVSETVWAAAEGQ